MFGRSIRHADGDVVAFGAVQVRLTVSRRARRISLRLDRTRGEVLAIAPSLRRLGEAAAFARQRHDWIAERLADLPSPRRLSPGQEINLFGDACRLGRVAGRASLEGPGWERGVRLPLTAGEDAFARAVVQLVRRAALPWFEERCRAHCATLGVPLPKLALADARTRWGSCTQAHRGRPASIRMSWRLALAPREVADYVAAHECAHLIEGNHGPRFWALVGMLIGDERPHRAWLRRHGNELYGFGP